MNKLSIFTLLALTLVFLSCKSTSESSSPEDDNAKNLIHSPLQESCGLVGHKPCEKWSWICTVPGFNVVFAFSGHCPSQYCLAGRPKNGSCCVGDLCNEIRASLPIEEINYYVKNKIEYNEVTPTSIRNFKQDHVPFHPWGLAYFDQSPPGSCFVGYVDTKSMVAYLHPAGKKNELDECADAGSPPAKVPLPYDDYITYPIRNDTFNIMAAHLQLAINVTKSFDIESHSTQQGVGFFLSKDLNRQLHFNFNSRSLHKGKFNYNGEYGDLSLGKYSCGYSGKPACWPTKEWSCAIAQGFSHARPGYDLDKIKRILCEKNPEN